VNIEIGKPRDEPHVGGQFFIGDISGDLYIKTDHGMLMLPELRHTIGPEVSELPAGTKIVITV
jgi:hypothetical protein